MCSKNKGLAYLQTGIAWKAAKNSRTKAEHGGCGEGHWGVGRYVYMYKHTEGLF